jgi:hypothetical protein
MIFFDTVIKRVNNFSIQSYEKNNKDLLNFFEQNELFQLSILTSSISLYEDVKKNKTKKIESSLLNYFSRAHFNPTPFGLFSSVGLIKWGENTIINKTKKIELSVKFDNLFSASQISLRKDIDICDLEFSINPSISILNDAKIGFYKSKSLDNDKI